MSIILVATANCATSAPRFFSSLKLTSHENYNFMYISRRDRNVVLLVSQMLRPKL